MRKSNVSKAHKYSGRHGFKIGDQVVYYPIKKVASDNIHWPAVIESIGERRIGLMAKTPQGEKRRSVTPAMIARQHELPL